MKIKHHITRFLPILLFALPSCSGRTYEPFGELPEETVKAICEAHALRVDKTKSEAKYYFVDFCFGKFNENAYVTILNYDNPKYAFNCVCVDVYLKGTFICTLGDPSYDLDVYVDGEGSYSLEEAYDLGKLSDTNIRTIIKIAAQERY